MWLILRARDNPAVLTLTLAGILSAYDASYLHPALSTGAELFSASLTGSLRNKYPFIKPPSEYRSLREASD